jgi:FkbM family methyltransferase
MKYPRMTAIFKDAIWKSKTPGFYVEIGAFDGKKKNSTIILEQAGWNGVCIEPTPESFAQLKRNRQCRCENVAVWKETGTIEFATFHNDPAWNGIKESLDKEHRAALKNSSTIIVKTKTWNDLKFPNHIDYLQLDVEGAELEVLNCIDWNNQTIRYVCLEDNDSRGGSLQYKKYMENLGFQLILQQHVDFLYFKP